MTTKDDEILDAIRRRREALAEALDFDLKKIVAELQRAEADSGQQTVTRPPRRPLATRPTGS